MTFKFVTMAALVALPIGAMAEQIFTPERGTNLRSELMNTVRPYAESVFGAPVEFVVHDLLVQGDHAYAWLTAQRPGGGQIDLTRAPAAKDIMFGVNDHTDINVFYERSGAGWKVYDWAAFATDVWWQRKDICAGWGDLLDYGCN